jgi:hypothetical protein
MKNRKIFKKIRIFGEFTARIVPFLLGQICGPIETAEHLCRRRPFFLKIFERLISRLEIMTISLVFLHRQADYKNFDFGIE